MTIASHIEHPMRICVQFHFSDESNATATTGVEGEVTDLILPSVGDMVWHSDVSGTRVLGRVKQRIYDYDLPQGINVNGTVTVTIVLDKILVQ